MTIDIAAPRVQARSDHELRRVAARIRRSLVTTVQAAGSGHLGGSLSVADILTVLYFDELRIDATTPRDPNRDRFVLSKGHCTPALYATLAERGYFPAELLAGFRSMASDLSGHVEMTRIPGVDMSAGSLGQGLSAAVGMALASRVDGRGYRVYAVTGDGEMQEGQIWEAVMSAGHYRLGNLTLMVDNNNLQIDGCVEDVMSIYPLADKLRAFTWHVQEIDGNDITAIRSALNVAREVTDAPSAIVARTVKGKGVGFMENDAAWHGSLPSKEQFEMAFADLDATIAGLEGTSDE